MRVPLQLRLSPELRFSPLLHAGLRSFARPLLPNFFLFLENISVKKMVSQCHFNLHSSYNEVECPLIHLKAIYLYFPVNLWFSIITFDHFSIELFILLLCRSFLYFAFCLWWEFEEVFYTIRKLTLCLWYELLNLFSRLVNYIDGFCHTEI